MNKDIFEKLRTMDFGEQTQEISVQDIVHIPDGTLVFGYKNLRYKANGTNRATFHVYKKNDMINHILYSGSEVLECDAFDSMPLDILDGVLAYGAPTSYEFLQILGDKFGLNIRLKMYSPFSFSNEEQFKKAIEQRVSNRLSDYANATVVEGDIFLPDGGFYGHTAETFYKK